MSKPAGSKPAKEIRLSCEYSGAPGLDWYAEVVFRPTAEGSFEVLRRVNPAGPIKSVEIVQAPLTWRSAAAWLAWNDEPLAGDLLEHIDVYGVPAFAADMLRLAWVIEENPAEPQKQYLNLLSDEELEYLWSAYDSLCSAPAQDWLLELVQLLESLGCPTASPTQATRQLQLPDLPAARELLEALSAGLERREEIRSAALRPFRAAIETILRADRFATRGSVGAGDRQRRDMAMRNFLEKYVLEHDALPSGLASVPGVGSVDIDDLAARTVESYLRAVGNRRLTREELEELALLRRPSDREDRLLLLASWTLLESKPQDPSTIRPFAQKDIAFLQWLFGDDVDADLRSLIKVDSVTAHGLANWVSAREKELLTETQQRLGSGRGGTHGAALRQAALRSAAAYLGKFGSMLGSSATDQ